MRFTPRFPCSILHSAHLQAIGRGELRLCLIAGAVINGSDGSRQRLAAVGRLATKITGNFFSTGDMSGHLPVDNAVPIDWNSGCAVGAQLPDWFENDDWHKEIYYEYSATLPCTVAVDCLTVNNMPAPNNDIEMLIVFAGKDLNNTHDVNDLTQYYENENNTVNRIYDMAETDDVIRVLAQ